MKKNIVFLKVNSLRKTNGDYPIACIQKIKNFLNNDMKQALAVLKMTLFIYLFICLFVDLFCVCWGHVWRSEDHLWKAALSYSVEPGDLGHSVL